ncbi:MAG: tetratricopeptide repeat protein, partial [Caldilineaceae bacterium]|nr:tetratricopeptide repeat protein [Caldilineaceae bacterium]
MQESELQSPELKTGLPADETHQDSVEATWASDQVTQASLVRWVNLAFKHCHSILSLSRLSLANSPLIVPALVLDPVSPTADERGRAVRLLLRWAVTQLAPGPVQYPIDSERPLDDPTWRDPLWWRYNILRHRYLEPLHPDEFIDGGRFTETLLALTGIPSPDTFFQERNRGVREVAERLWQQLADGAGNRALQEMALDDTYRPLRAHPTAQALLGIASTFDDVFPRRLLLSLAAEERLTDAEAGLGYLSTRRFLLSGDEGASLWISPVLRAYVYSHQPRREQQRRHRQVARDYEQQGDALSAAQHRQLAGEWPRAAEILLSASEALVNELQFDELREALGQFRAETLSAGQWREIQILLADLCARAGQREEALLACRRALKDAEDPAEQARVYRRMGKLYEMHNQMHALTYYQQAAERFTASEPEFVQMLKDRAWLYIMRKEWDKAERDLNLALEQAPADAVEDRADIYDALASLHRHQQRYDVALTQAQRALSLREESGDLLRIAKGLGNLGLLYQAMQDHVHAIAAHQEAMTVYQRLGNQELTASALLNIGMAFHLDGRLQDAVQHYQQCLTLCQEIGYPLVEVKARSNLAEVFAELGQTVTARRHWQAGYALSLQAGFEDQTSYFVQLSRRFDGLAELTEPPADTEDTPTPLPASLSAESQAALLLAERQGQVTPRTLMDETGVSKATATRRLAELADSGFLARVGQGRGTYYVLSERRLP